MKPDDFIVAARVPQSLKPQTFGPWNIERWDGEAIRKRKLTANQQLLLELALSLTGFPTYTLLRRFSWATMHLGDGMDIVMEDSRQELRKHLPIWLNAKGSVLVTGLGLGCVVRGLLASRDVDHVTVVEIDKQVLRVVGHEFKTNKRVELIHGDALMVNLRGRKFDFAWHDLWTDGDQHLQILHARLIVKFSKICRAQGAWMLPRFVKAKLAGRVKVIG